MPPPEADVTQLLLAWGKGDQSALEKLMPLVYDELRRLAKRYMRAQPREQTLPATALVHEAFLKLIDEKEKTWHNRVHFMAVAAQVMRHLLVDYARSRHSQKRGGARQKVTLDEGAAVSLERSADLVALDEALRGLEQMDPRKSKVVEMRYFGGLTVDEVAGALNISPVTVMRDWQFARTWLLRELCKSE
jgi:RNA polymerase sigma factor (TIGR02999 family)